MHAKTISFSICSPFTLAYRSSKVKKKIFINAYILLIKLLLIKKKLEKVFDRVSWEMFDKQKFNKQQNTQTKINGFQLVAMVEKEIYIEVADENRNKRINNE